MLDEFRSTLITWDKATSRIYSPVTANASDENGRKLVVQIVNSGQVEDLTGATLHLYWETRDKAHDGLDVFKAVDLGKGEFELSYTTGMLSNKGVLNANLVLIDNVGRVVSERFKITVTEGIDNDAIQSENSFSSLTQALIDISNLEQNYAPRLNDLTAQLQQTANGIKPNWSVWTEFEKRGVNVDWYGAKGDGLTDDSAAIQTAFDNAKGSVVHFSSGKKYLINQTVSADLKNVKGIAGNSAHLITDNDIVILRVHGSFGSDAGGPGAYNFEIAPTEMMPIIQGLRFSSSKPNVWGDRVSDPSIGTGLELEKTHSVTIKDCFFHHLHTGISYAVKNRNSIITNNQFFDLWGYGLHFKPLHDIHQIMITNNFFQSFYKAVFDEGSQFGDMVFQGNLLENTSSARASSHFVHITSNVYNTFLNIIGNRFQDKSLTTTAFIELDFKDNTYAREIIISENEINSDDINDTGCVGILLKNPRNFIINGNNIRNFRGYAVKVEGSHRGVTGAIVSNNSVRSTVGLISINAPEKPLDNIIINNNISIDSLFEGAYTEYIPNISLIGGLMTQININNNQLYYYVITEQPSLGSVGAYYISATNFIRGLVIHSNSLNSRSLLGVYGLAIDDKGAGWTQNMVVKDNMVHNFNDTLKLPTTSAVKVVADNVIS